MIVEQVVDIGDEEYQRLRDTLFSTYATQRLLYVPRNGFESTFVKIMERSNHKLWSPVVRWKNGRKIITLYSFSRLKVPVESTGFGFLTVGLCKKINGAFRRHTLWKLLELDSEVRKFIRRRRARLSRYDDVYKVSVWYREYMSARRMWKQISLGDFLKVKMKHKTHPEALK